jgi:NAD(P) transhydrogenase subunit alpha
MTPSTSDNREMMGRVVASSDVVITTALIPGRSAPVLVTDTMVAGMPKGAVVVDLAAERGGNVEPSKPDETVIAHGVTVLGPTNLPATVPHHASQMYAKNISTLLLHLVQNGDLHVDLDEEITASTLVSRGGDIIHPRIKELLTSTKQSTTD